MQIRLLTSPVSVLPSGPAGLEHKESYCAVTRNVPRGPEKAVRKVFVIVCTPRCSSVWISFPSRVSVLGQGLDLHLFFLVPPTQPCVS